MSLIPIRLALPITALRDEAPSAAAMPAALKPSSASLFSLSTASSVHSICAPNGLQVLNAGIRLADRRADDAIGMTRSFMKNK